MIVISGSTVLFTMIVQHSNGPGAEPGYYGEFYCCVASQLASPQVHIP